MAKNKVSEWSATPANNLDIGGIDIAEGCAPAGINNAIRELMSQVKDMQAGTDGDNFTVGGNLSVTGTADFVGGLATDLPIADGGTGASTASDARTNLGLGTMATQNATAVAITGGTVEATFTGNLTGNVTGDVSGNAGTVTNGVYTTNFTGSNQSLVANGYQKLPGGLILQWGTYTSTSDDTQTFSFPTSFTTSCLFVVGTFIDVTSYPVPVTAKTTTQFTVDRNNSVDNNQDFMMFALGY
jgi:hypothetical protein